MLPTTLGLFLCLRTGNIMFSDCLSIICTILLNAIPEEHLEEISSNYSVKTACFSLEVFH